MTNTENNVAAQAGDEPMREKLALVIARLEQIAGNFTDDYRNAAEEALVCARAISAKLATPRATADVELDAARYRWLRERPYSDWKRIAFNTMDDHPFAIKCRDEEIDVARLATTKPGA